MERNLNFISLSINCRPQLRSTINAQARENLKILRIKKFSTKQFFDTEQRSLIQNSNDYLIMRDNVEHRILSKIIQYF